MTLTTTQQNLCKLADHIEANVPYFRINQTYFRSTDKCASRFYSYDDCGTSGSVLGHAPFVDGLEPLEKEFFTIPACNARRSLSFHVYGRRLFSQLYTPEGLTILLWYRTFKCVNNSSEAIANNLRAVSDELHRATPICFVSTNQ